MNRLNPTRLFIIVVCCMSFFVQDVRATHIVGGEMTYTCLGNDQYEIQLTIFRDCENGNPLAFFDDPAKIGIYNSAGELIDSLFIPFDPLINDTLDQVLSDPCFVTFTPVCVHTTTYTAIKTLPIIPGGYELIYQRCCRNQTIANIVLPLDTGATFGVSISENALNECNSSAKFNTWPPIYICVNQPIFFDQSATDIDGDSIVYRMCTPLNGATPATPEPFPSEQTIPQEIVWVDPPYNVDNMLGGIPLAIDEDTGLLTGTPNTIGQFVVGICLEEYRDGELISTTRRDFQYNVGTCSFPLSAFFAPELSCDGLTVTFNNLSTDALSYEWHFNDPGNPNFISTDFSPTYTFTDTGTYNVMLIAQTTPDCRDTFDQEIRVQLNSLFAEFDFGYANCTDSLTIEVSDLSIDTIFNIVEWNWTLENAEGDTLFTSNEQNPIFNVVTSTTATLTLVVTSENGCTEELTTTFPANVFGEDTFPDTIVVCGPTSVPLNPTPLNGVSYFWSPPTYLDDPTSATPISTPLDDITYVVFMDNQGECEIYDTITILIDTIMADFTAEVPCDFEVVYTNLSSNNAIGYNWFFNDPSNPGASSMLENPTFVYGDTGIYTTMLIADIGPYCQDTAYQEFYIDAAVIIPDFNIEVSNCTEEYDLQLTDLTIHLAGLNFSWDWQIIDDQGMMVYQSSSQNPNFVILESGTYTIELLITDDEGCTSMIEQPFEVMVFTPGMIPDAMINCAGDSVLLNPDANLNLTYSWSPPIGLSDPTAASPLALPDESTTYSVTVTDENGCTFVDDVFVDVDTGFFPPLDAFAERDTIFIGDTTQLISTVDPGYTYFWQPGEFLSNTTISDPLAFPEVTTVFELEITDQDGCMNVIQLLVVVVERPCEDPNIFLPNAFTPNGDGENEVLRLMGNGVEEMQLIIYNRWGQKVFESFEQSVGWDGTFKGEALAPDAYGFYLYVRCVGGEEYFKKGNITLLR